jgi:prefoldin subunit 5
MSASSTIAEVPPELEASLDELEADENNLNQNIKKKKRKHELIGNDCMPVMLA